MTKIVLALTLSAAMLAAALVSALAQDPKGQVRAQTRRSRADRRLPEVAEEERGPFDELTRKNSGLLPER